MFDEDYGVQSYFGESGDCDFFGDTSMSGGFASGMGEAGFVSEAFAQDSMGGSFFTEASEFDSSAYGSYFTEGTEVKDDVKTKSSTMDVTTWAPENTTNASKLIKRGPKLKEQRQMWVDRDSGIRSTTPTHPESERSKRFNEREKMRTTADKRLSGLAAVHGTNDKK